MLTYMIGCENVTYDVEDSEHFYNDCPITKRVTNSSEPWCNLERDSEREGEGEREGERGRERERKRERNK